MLGTALADTWSKRTLTYTWYSDIACGILQIVHYLENFRELMDHLKKADLSHEVDIPNCG